MVWISRGATSILGLEKVWGPRCSPSGRGKAAGQGTSRRRSGRCCRRGRGGGRRTSLRSARPRRPAGGSPASGSPWWCQRASPAVLTKSPLLVDFELISSTLETWRAQTAAGGQRTAEKRTATRTKNKDKKKNKNVSVVRERNVTFRGTARLANQPWLNCQKRGRQISRAVRGERPELSSQTWVADQQPTSAAIL